MNVCFGLDLIWGFYKLPLFLFLFGCWLLLFSDIIVCFCFSFTLADVTVLTVPDGLSCWVF